MHTTKRNPLPKRPHSGAISPKQQPQSNTCTFRVIPVLLLVVALITFVNLQSNNYDIKSWLDISDSSKNNNARGEEEEERLSARELEQEKPQFLQVVHKETETLQENYRSVQQENEKLKKDLEKVNEKLQMEKDKRKKDVPKKSTNVVEKDKAEKLQQDLEQAKEEKEQAQKDTSKAEKEAKYQRERVDNLQKELEAAKEELEQMKQAAKATEDNSEAASKTVEITEKDNNAPVDTVPKIPDGPILDADGRIIVQPLPFGETCPELAWPTPPAGTPTDLERIWDVTKPYCNETTGALVTKIFYAGYRNQVMTFSGLVLWSMKNGHKQILLETLNHKDLFGTNKKVPHEALFDVEHWNSYYPALPRMVHCDPTIMIDYNCSVDPQKPGEFKDPIHDMPHKYKTYKNEHFVSYTRYTRKKGPLADPFPNPADVLIQSGALRPHPDMRAHAKKLFETMNVKEDNYMAVHARIEPDMQKHPVCRDEKVLNLTSIVGFLEKEWKDPPVTAIVMPINRYLLEKEGLIENYKKGEEINWIAVNNLKEFDRISKEGLWGGRAKIFTFGSKALNGTKYAETMWSIGGSILDFDIATNAKIFVGTEISSFSADLVSNRFYRGKFDNYYYRPDGLHKMTDENSNEPPAFKC